MTVRTALPLLPDAPARRWVVDPARGLAVASPAGLMGIINATPDSFSDGGAHLAAGPAVAAATAMAAAGAAWLDVGGESTRPGAVPVDAASETARVLPVLAGLRPLGLPLSIDTAKAAVARAALAAGAAMVNDVSAGADPGMFAVVAEARCPMVLMHMQGTPVTMQQDPRYGDVVDEVLAFLALRLAAAVRAGVAEHAVLLDPGIGFGKRLEHNLALLRALPRLAAETGRPLVLGVSRKAMVAAAAGAELPAAARDGLSHLVHALCAPWCALLRVHDVPGAAAALRLGAGLRGPAAETR
jgi:dihydropteroate synthase